MTSRYVLDLSERLVDAFQKQVYQELSASTLYMRLSTWAEVHGYPGTAQFFQAQSEDEYEHFQKFARFLARHGIPFSGGLLKEWIGKTPTSFLNLFQIGLELEKENTRSILHLLSIAEEDGCAWAIPFLRDMIREQEEEVVKFQDWITRIEPVADNPAGLLILDSLLAREEDN